MLILFQPLCNWRVRHSILPEIVICQFDVQTIQKISITIVSWLVWYALPNNMTKTKYTCFQLDIKCLEDPFAAIGVYHPARDGAGGRGASICYYGWALNFPKRVWICPLDVRGHQGSMMVLKRQWAFVYHLYSIINIVPFPYSLHCIHCHKYLTMKEILSEC